ncbi:hypothetical protein HK101_011256 [Irineochytrium annulatum]|nr:hypothetical protein HK101_011256 [Irineochytrium annulatum]
MADRGVKKRSSMPVLNQSPQPRSSVSLMSSTESIPERKSLNDPTNGLVPPSATEAYMERLKGWTEIVKRLISYFEMVLDQEKKLAELCSKSAKDLSAPLRVHGNEVFDPDESVQSVFKALFESQSRLSSEHNAAATHIENETIPNLKTLLSEARKKCLDRDGEWTALDKALAKDRELYSKLASNVKASIQYQLKIRAGVANPEAGMDKDVPRDPWIANLQMQRHISNLLANQSEIRSQLASQEQNIAVFEQVTVQHLRNTLSSYIMTTKKGAALKASPVAPLIAAIDAINPEADWTLFRRRRADVIMDRLRPLLRRDEVIYDGMNDSGCEAVKEGTLMKRIPGMLRSKGFKNGHYVLTVSGFLHGFASPDAVDAGTENPELSLWLPECIVGLRGQDPKEPNEFTIQEKSGGFLKGAEKHRLKAPSNDEADFWYELVVATAIPVVPRPDLLTSLEESQAVEVAAVTGAAVTPSLIPLPGSQATSPTRPPPTPVEAKVAYLPPPVPITTPQPEEEDEEDDEEEEDPRRRQAAPADLAALRNSMFSTVGAEEAQVAPAAGGWGSGADSGLTVNAWADESNAWA